MTNTDRIKDNEREFANVRTNVWIEEFMKCLDGLSAEELEQIREYYQELLCDNLEQGKTEEECLAVFGDPREKAARFQEEYKKNKNMEDDMSKKSRMDQAVGKIHTIDIQAESTEIEVCKAPAGSSVCVEFEPEEERDIVTSREENGVFMFKHKLRGRKIMGLHDLLGFFLNRREGSKIRVWVPEDFRGELKVQDANAKITMKEICALSAVSLRSSNASVSMENCTGDKMNLRTSNASIILSQISASEIEAVTSNSRIETENCRCTDMKLHSSNGALHLTGLLTKSLTAETSNGKIAIEGCRSDEIFLCTSNAAIFGTVIGDMREYAIKSKTSNASNNLPNLRYQDQVKTMTAITSNGTIKVDFIPEK